MIVSIADVHFGRRSAEYDRTMERDLTACLRHLEPDVEGLVLLGDIFDYYIEYRHLVPKGYPRFQALLAEWTAGGIPVVYLVGNHDPWHQDYFQQELGVELHLNPVVRRLNDRAIYLAHGDGLPPERSVYRLVKPLLRSPVLVNLYRTILPADVGVRLARWYSRTFAEETPDPAVASGLRTHARRILRDRSADVAMFGHSHIPEITRWEHGTYLNCGSWFSDRTFGVLDEQGVFLRRWNGKEALLVEQSQTVEENPEP